MTCLLCGEPHPAPIWPNYVQCPMCDTITRLVPGDSPFGNAAYGRPPNAADARWLGLLERHQTTGRLLDLGCGNGSFLHVARTRGWQTAGVEREPSLARDAQNLDLSVVEGDIDEWTPPEPERFNVVRLWFVLEHVRAPGRLLRAALESLRPGGLLMLAVPNDAGWLSRAVMKHPDDRFWEHPLHLHHFPPFGLEQWLDRLGFDLVLAEAGRPTELMRGGTLPLCETWEKVRNWDASLSELFYKLGVGRSREMLLRVRAEGTL